MATDSNQIILFDGVCKLCTGVVQFVIRHDRRKQFKFAAIQSEFGRSVLRKHHFDPDHVDSFVLILPCGPLTESDATIELVRQFGGLWRICILIRILPKCLRDRAYRFIASRRFAWFGQRDSCFMTAESHQDRFLS